MARQPYGRCLHHLEDVELAEFLGGLAPGGAVDLRGTTVTAGLLDRVLIANGGRFGRARFDGARFLAAARFGETVFTGDASFDGAVFDALASFYGAHFKGNLSLRGVRFARELSLHGSRVRGHLSMDYAVVTSDALFGEAMFGSASFERTGFQGFASFDRAHFTGDAIFRGARFWRAVSFLRTGFGGAACLESVRFVGTAFLAPSALARRLVLSGARAHSRVEVHATGSVTLAGARVLGRLVVRMSEGDIDLSGLVSRGESQVVRQGGAVRVMSMELMDAEDLTIDGADLTACRLAAVPHPERLRLRSCAVAKHPAGRQLRLSWPFKHPVLPRLSWAIVVVIVAVAALVWSGLGTPGPGARRPPTSHRVVSTPSG